MNQKKKKESLMICTDEKFYARVEEYAWNNDKKLLVINGDKEHLILQDIETKKLIAIFSDKEITNIHPTATIFELAETIASMPEDRLKELAYTEDLKHEFSVQRAQNIIISKVFLMECLDLDIDLIEKERNRQHKLITELQILKVYQYRALWDLIKLVFPHIKKAISEFPFSKPKDLLIDIIVSQKNSNYERLVFEDYIEFLSFKLEKRYFYHKWIEYIFCFTDILEENNSVVKILKKHYKDYCDQIDLTIEQLATKRTKKGKIIKSEVWQNGTRLTCSTID